MLTIIFNFSLIVKFFLCVCVFDIVQLIRTTAVIKIWLKTFKTIAKVLSAHDSCWIWLINEQMLFHKAYYFNWFTMFIIVVSFLRKQSRLDGSIVELRVFDVKVVNNLFPCIKENILSDNFSSQNVLNHKGWHSISGTFTVSWSTVSTDNSHTELICRFL